MEGAKAQRKSGYFQADKGGARTCYLLASKVEKGTHEPRDAKNVAAEVGRGKEMDFILEPSEGVWPCQHLDFSLVALILAYGSQNCKRPNLHCLKPLLLWLFVTAAIGN